MPVSQHGDPRTLGLNEDEVAARREAGQANVLPPRSGRSVGEIVRANVFTRINALLGILFVLVMATGSWINGAFGLLIVANSIIGIIQELRAKHTLDSLAVVGEARPHVRREGREYELAQEEIVLDDILIAKPGDQIIVDGEMVEAFNLELDESLLTGESDPVAKNAGDSILSGSFVASGTGAYRATSVGKNSYAAQLTAEASKFSLVHSDLQAGINRILKTITWILIPVGILTIVGQIRVGESDWRAIILSVTGALVPMIPEGLVLITSTAFALGVIRLGRRKCLVNELPAIEGLAHVDVVCADKTGTLTENRLAFSQLQLLKPDGALADSAIGTDSSRDRSEREALATEALRQLAAADPTPNASMAAIIEAIGIAKDPWAVQSAQPFTSALKWSGTSFTNGQNWVLGAPDVLAAHNAPAAEEASRLAAHGLRVLLLGEASVAVTDDAAPGDVSPVSLIVLDQQLRPDAGPTLEYFASQDVQVKVISGDNAASVGAVAESLGMDAGDPVDARSIKDEDWDRTVNNSRVFGRVTPQQKRSMVAALQKAGHTVAMTGDGVNDVLALKDADLGVAMGSGTSATRSVAKIVLLDDKFATLPYVVAEGRRVLSNIERVAKLFLTKTVYSSILAILVLLFSVPFPFQPIHVTITGWFTIGIPAFLLSLPRNNDKARPHFVGRVMTFGLPSGLAVAVASFTTYMLVRNPDFVGAHGAQAPTAALLALIIGSSWVLAVVARPYEWWKIALILLPLAGYGLIFNLDVTQRIFMLDSSNLDAMLVGTLIGLVAAVFIEALWWFLGIRGGKRPAIWVPREEREAARKQRQLEHEEFMLQRREKKEHRREEPVPAAD
ncbi:MAG: HAD-IC family P-type ATPase [Ancrocorticia sp.]|uniref:HAD-IC family P-type ATPase n=1 Tax=Ancrocorticia sp. TaxID=2593684 RepID=UPI003F91517B